ncbi:MAG: maleylpyruvate isomerase N-terminal domain-containing protein, partial [Actinomycetes bacterium]
MTSSAELLHQTELLVTSVRSMRDEQISEPSLLPNWSRGHVLAHLDGNALGLARLIRW